MIDKLRDSLKQISEDEDFLYCVEKLLKTDEHRKKVIEFIEKDNRATYETVQLLALSLKQEWKKENNKMNPWDIEE